MEHFFHEVETQSRFRFIFGDGQVVLEVKVAHERSIRVPVLVDTPLVLGSVRMTWENSESLSTSDWGMDSEENCRKNFANPKLY